MSERTEINERAFDLTDDTDGETYGHAAHKRIITDYLMWADRVANDYRGVTKRFLAAEFERLMGRPIEMCIWTWRDNFVGGFDTLAEAQQAAEAKGKEKSGERAWFVWDTLTNEPHWSKGAN